jgi:hypothetical protein
VFLTYRDKTPLTTNIQNVQYADDLALVGETSKELQDMLNGLDRSSTHWGMSINEGKTKILSIGEVSRLPITLRGKHLRK